MRYLLLALLALSMSACETLRVGLATDYGTFSYELPMPRPGK